MATAVRPLAGTYEIDPVHSTVQFAVEHIVSTFRASFDDVEGRLVAGKGPTSLRATAQVESVSIAHPPEFREHVVRGDDFFHADAHPEMTFRSTQIQLGADGSATVTGDLTIRGITRSITAEGSTGVRRRTRSAPSGPRFSCARASTGAIGA